MKPQTTLDFAAAWADAEVRLAAADPFWAPRPPQAECARLIHEALDTGTHAAIDAPTGLGKTAATLIAAEHLTGRVVISTATRALQAQIRDVDIPALRAAGVLTRSTAILDGRGRFLCRARTQHALKGSNPVARPYLQSLLHIAEWDIDDGRRESLPVKVPDHVWDQACSDSDVCRILECMPADCHYLRAREEARAADIVICNHHILLADAAIKCGGMLSWGRRERAKNEPDQPAILGPYQHLVVDEAHALESAAESFAQRQVTTAGVHALATRLTRLAGGGSLGSAQMLRARNHILDVEAEVNAAIRDLPHDALISPIDESVLEKAAEYAREAASACTQAVAYTSPGGDAERILTARASCSGLAERLDAVDKALMTGADDLGPRAPSVTLGPTGKFAAGVITSQLVDASIWLQEMLFSQVTCVLLSATLAVPGRRDYVPQRLGLKVNVVSLDTTFDLARQRLVYVTPRATNGHVAAARVGPDDVAEIRALLDASRGRALVLFPAHADLRYVFEELDGTISHPLLAQGITCSEPSSAADSPEPTGSSKPRRGTATRRAGRDNPAMPASALARAFSNDTASVLLATRSFFEGIDIPGEALSLVIIARFPNLRPDDPLTLARRRELEARRIDPWNAYQEPAMQLLFRQAAGRAIRRVSDVGVIAVVDPRCGSKTYAKRALVSLRPSDFVDSIDDVRKFLASG